MKDALTFILSHIVEHADSIQITETNDGDKILLIVDVHPDDMGKVIGKSGRIIRAIRDLIKLMAAKSNTYVDIKLAEDIEKSE